jgi:trigger factor
MNISRENIDELNAILKIQVDKADYEEKVEKVLKDYRKKANMPGFRPGKVPFGLVRNMYGKAVLVEEVNKLVSESITNHISEEKLNVLGEPMPKEDEQKQIDWEKDENFEFEFEIGLAPEFELKLSKRDKANYYSIAIQDDMIDGFVSSHQKRYGKVEPTDVVVSEENIKGNFTECDAEGSVIEGGVSVEEGTIALAYMKDDEIKKSFEGAKAGDVLNFDLKKAYPNDADLASLLKIEKEQVAEMGANFQLTITELSKFVESEVNQELFDKVYGEGAVKSVEEFRERIAMEIKGSLAKESDYKLMLDIKEKLVKKAKVELPDTFLKKWLTFINKEKFTAEQIETDYPKFQEDMKWQLIKDKLIKEHEIKVDAEEVLEFTKEFTRAQFAQYGLNNMPEEQVESYAKEMLKKPEETRNIYERKYEEKVVATVKELIKIEDKEVSSEEFNAFFENK